MLSSTNDQAGRRRIPPNVVYNNLIIIPYICITASLGAAITVTMLRTAQSVQTATAPTLGVTTTVLMLTAPSIVKVAANRSAVYQLFKEKV